MKKFFLFAVSLLVAVSCDMTVRPHDGNGTKIPISIDVVPETKVTDNAFESGDRIGLFVVNTGESGLQVSGNYVDNMGFSFVDNKWTPDEEIYWKDSSTPADFYVYFPYSESVESIDSYKFTVNSDQSVEGGYESSEFLWGKRENVSPTESAVGINVRHLMSNLVIYLEPGKGFEKADLEGASVKVCGIAPSAIINLETGSVVSSDVPVEITPKSESGYYRALIVPQNVVDKPLIKVTVDGIVYTLNSSINFESGKQYKCTVKVSKMSNGINIGIDGWETDGVDYGGEAN